MAARVVAAREVAARKVAAQVAAGREAAAAEPAQKTTLFAMRTSKHLPRHRHVQSAMRTRPLDAIAPERCFHEQPTAGVDRAAAVCNRGAPRASTRSNSTARRTLRLCVHANREAAAQGVHEWSHL